jgi:hypothetical protein
MREVVESCSGLSRTELAQTVCELLGWKRLSGGLKAQECRELLEQLELAGALVLPERQPRRPFGSRTRVPVTPRGDRRGEMVGEVSDFSPIEMELVETVDQRLLFRELVGRHHYLGHAVPFGAHLRYLGYASKPERVVVGGVQFSSPAWRMALRDAWIGWDDETRQRNLQRNCLAGPGGSRPGAHVTVVRWSRGRGLRWTLPTNIILVGGGHGRNPGRPC